MCGIAGILHFDAANAVHGDVLGKMLNAIVHRGPDDEGTLVDGNLAMGMRRLSIIDLQGGHQPIFNEDQSVAVVFNGEIYNFQELRSQLQASGHEFRTKSDTEVLVHGYEEWGDSLPIHLNGMFAISLWDRRRRRLLLIRDHIGIKPLYVYQDKDKLVWASEIKSILQVPGVRRETDINALADFMTLGYVPGPRTMFSGISKLAPATTMTIDVSGIRSESYWELRYSPSHRSLEDWVAAIREHVDDAVRLQMISDVPIGAFLSGGLDSTAIVATMKKLGCSNISTYAIGYGDSDSFHDETKKAALVAKEIGTNHHEIIAESNVAELFPKLVYHLDEPVTDTSFVVTYLVSRLARESSTVILSGLGGDEIFGGYRRYLGYKADAIYMSLPRGLRESVIAPLVRMLPVDRGSKAKAMFRYLRGYVEHASLPAPDRYQGHVGVFTTGQRSAISTPDFAAAISDFDTRRVASYYEQAIADAPLQRMMFADLKSSLVDSLLHFTDKMTMAVSLEARVPLLDRRLVELAATVPDHLQISGFSGLKNLFRHAMKDRIPAQVLHQRKQGFGTPISRWFRTSLRDLVNDYLSEDRIRRRGYFQPRAVAEIVDAHMKQRADHSEHILALLTFELWNSQFLDQTAC